MPLLGSPFNVEIPEASGGEAGDQSGTGGATIKAKLLTGASAAQYGEVVFNESALGPLIGTTRCKKRELDTLFKAKGGSDMFRAWHGVQDGTTKMVTDTGVRQLIMAAGDQGGETAVARCRGGRRRSGQGWRRRSVAAPTAGSSIYVRRRAPAAAAVGAAAVGAAAAAAAAAAAVVLVAVAAGAAALGAAALAAAAAAAVPVVVRPMCLTYVLKVHKVVCARRSR